MIALFKTPLTEEILFRGFLAKRLISIAGFIKGNLLQSAIFGAIHAGLFSFATNKVIFLSVIFLIPAVGAYVSITLSVHPGDSS